MYLFFTVAYFLQLGIDKHGLLNNQRKHKCLQTPGKENHINGKEYLCCTQKGAFGLVKASNIG